MRLTNHAPYLFQKRGIYYFSRRVPEDLKAHYKRSRIVVSLRTKSRRAAVTRASSLASRLEEDWFALRLKNTDDPLKRFLREPSTPSIPDGESSGPYLSEAKALYVKAKGEGRSVTFAQAADRAVRYFIDMHGDRPIDAYTRREANSFRDALFERGLAKPSVQRVLSVLRAIMNFATREHGLDEIRSFSGLYLGEDQPSQPQKRNPIPTKDIRAVQRTCREIDDEARWLIALVSDTGMRLGEAAGLVASDIQLEGAHPHVQIRPHPWRRLKTSGSARVVPLVGTALWAAERAVHEAGSKFLFPKYCDESGCKANSASGALNRWLAYRVPEGCVVHSFRHSFRDRLRAVECPTDIIDRLGGWTVGGVGESYGAGYPIHVLYSWMKRIE